MPPTKVTEERRCLQKFLDEGKSHGLRFENGKFSFKTGTGVVLFETYGALLNPLPQSVGLNQMRYGCLVQYLSVIIS